MAAPIRVGVLHDMSSGPADAPSPGIDAVMQHVIDDVVGRGRLDGAVEFVPAYGLGLPGGTAAAVEHAYEELDRADVLMIVGPAIGDNSLVATPLAERYRIPTINWAGTERGRNEYMFHLQVGSHEDESIILARHLAEIGARRVGVVHDRSPIGRRYLHFLQAEAEAVGLPVACSASVLPTAEDASSAADMVVGVHPDAIVYLGLGLSAPAVASALAERGFDGARAMNTAGLRGYAPEFATLIEGWTYLDMVADDNTTLAAVRARLGDHAPAGVRFAWYWDMGQLVAEGLARAPERTRDGVKEGLEQVKWLPAAEGHEGTTLGFGHHDHGALHGRYLVLRQWRGGTSVQIG